MSYTQPRRLGVVCSFFISGILRTEQPRAEETSWAVTKNYGFLVNLYMLYTCINSSIPKHLAVAYVCSVPEA